MHEYQTTISVGDEGLVYYELEQKDSVRFLSNISNPLTRKEVLAWVNVQGYPIRLNVGHDAPKSFVDLLSPIPNRNEIHTNGQPLALAHKDNCREALRQRLKGLGSDLRHIIDNVRPSVFNGRPMSLLRLPIESSAPISTDDITVFNQTLMMSVARQGPASMLSALVDEMDAITNDVPHLKHTWNDETRGTVLAIPESKILHRRVGRDTAQVMWHADTTRGCILFCLLNDQKIPHRVLFEGNDKIR